MMPVVTSSNTQGHADPGLQRLLTSLDQLQSKVNGHDLDLVFLRDLFQSSDFQSLLKVHEKVTTPEMQEQQPLEENTLTLTCGVLEELQPWSSISEIQELCDILCKPHFRGMLSAHDRIAMKDFQPQLPEIPHEVDEDEESVKIIRLVKGNSEPLGATIRLHEETGVIHIARILHGGAADRSGLIHVGDEVLEVNGVSVYGKEPDEVVNILSDAVGPITLKLVPGDSNFGLYRESKMRMRAHFSYNPREDKLIPCKEAGLAFKKGDILHIVSQDDPNWWQARREGDRNMRAGLIPGRQLQERKEAMRGSTGMIHESTIKKDKDHDSPKKNYDAEEIVTYEEVERYYPRVGRYRPIVLIGPPGVGRNELKRRLMLSSPAHYKSTTPHTSRPKKPSEVDGEEYIFVSRPEMEKNIQSKRFVEHGEYKGNLYGTSLECIKSVINAGHVCVLCPHPQALKLLKTAELKPYIVLIKPPSLERLKDTRTTNHAKSTFDENNSRPFTNEEFQDMILSAARIESIYSHYFDQVIVNDDLQKAVSELCAAAQHIETEPQWVPASWIR